MKIINQEKFIQKKTSDTLVILGSGSSINKINEEGWKKISEVDSVGFNWFCHHSFGPTFYMIREQANTKMRSQGTETKKHLIEDLRKESYSLTCLIVHNTAKHSPKSYNYAKHHSIFSQNGIIVKDTKGRLRIAQFQKDIFDKGVFHGKCSLNNVLHIAVYLKYRKIFFAGVDLHNSQYFWLGSKVTRSNIKQKGLNRNSRHPVAKYVIPAIKKVKKSYKIEMYTLNQTSLLKKIMPYKEIR